MNRMQQDLHDLGAHLWPDDAVLRPGQAARGRPALRSRLAAVAVGAAVFIVLFAVIGLSIVLTHSSPKVPAASASPTKNGVVRVEVPVSFPGNPLTFEVARGVTLALHLHFGTPTPGGAWGVSTTSNPQTGFNAVQVPYPGAHPPDSLTDFYVAFQLPAVGTTQIAIGFPFSCSGNIGCPSTSPQFISIRAVAPPLLTATVTGHLSPVCPVGITSVPASCSETFANVPIKFQNRQDEVTVNERTDANGDYFAELPPGTWNVATTPAAVAGQQTTITVGAGQIVVDNIGLMGCSDTAPTSATRC
jgi:hypothetical protein